MVLTPERDRSLPWPKCVYRKLFNVSVKTIDVCNYDPAIRDNRLKPPATNTTDIDQYPKSLVFGELPGPYVCRTCPHRKET